MTDYRRTPEEIRRQLEARMEEIEEEAAKPSRRFPCAACRWGEGPLCHNPLMKGFDYKALWSQDNPRARAEQTGLCGPERALWEPRRDTLPALFHRKCKNLFKGWDWPLTIAVLAWFLILGATLFSMFKG